MKYLLLFGIIYIVYRYYKIRDEVKQRVHEFPKERQIQEETIEDFTDYEEVE